MSAGAIDNHLVPLKTLMAHPWADKLILFAITASPAIDTEHDIPFLAGISTDGKTVYIDRHYQFAQGDSRVLSAHERAEWWLVTRAKWAYDKAHPYGNTLEKMALENLKTRGDWASYNARIDKHLKEIEGEPILKVPKDLALYPYKDDLRLLKKIRDAQKG